MPALSLDTVSLALAIATVDGVSVDTIRIGLDNVYDGADARPIIVLGPDAIRLAASVAARLAEVGYVVRSQGSALGEAVDLYVSLPGAGGGYDTNAQHARDLALVGFLDLGLHQWEAWLAEGSAELPSDLEPHAVSIITSLRAVGDEDGVDPDARGNYLQAVASLTTSALQYFIARVGQY